MTAGHVLPSNRGWLSRRRGGSLRRLCGSRVASCRCLPSGGKLRPSARDVARVAGTVPGTRPLMEVALLSRQGREIALDLQRAEHRLLGWLRPASAVGRTGEGVCAGRDGRTAQGPGPLHRRSRTDPGRDGLACVPGTAGPIRQRARRASSRSRSHCRGAPCQHDHRCDGAPRTGARGWVAGKAAVPVACYRAEDGSPLRQLPPGRVLSGV